MPKSFSNLSAILNARIKMTLAKKKELQNDPRWALIPGSYFVPKEVIEWVLKSYTPSRNADLAAKFKRQRPQHYADVQLLNTICLAFGLVEPAAKVLNSGVIDLVYTPSVFRVNPTALSTWADHYGYELDPEQDLPFELVVQFGNAVIPIYWDAEEGVWTSVEMDGFKQFQVNFKAGTTQSRDGDIPVVDVEFLIEGKSRPGYLFTGKLGTTRDANRADMVDATVMVNALYSPEQPDSIADMEKGIKSYPTGGTYSFPLEGKDQSGQFVFEYGRYPVVSLKKERREKIGAGGKAQRWINYLVEVKTGDNRNKFMRLPSTETANFGLLESFYPCVNEDDELIEPFTEGEQFEIIFFHRQINRKRVENEIEEEVIPFMKADLTTNEEFTLLSADEIVGLCREAGVKPTIEGGASDIDTSLMAANIEGRMNQEQPDIPVDDFSPASAPAAATDDGTSQPIDDIQEPDNAQDLTVAVNPPADNHEASAAAATAAAAAPAVEPVAEESAPATKKKASFTRKKTVAAT